MSREIKFRGIRSFDGSFVYGDLLRAECNGYDFTYICDEPCISMRDSISEAFMEVDDNTIGQYTGLKDKNGVKIFEGDILNIRNVNYVVKYCSKEGRYELYDKVYCVYKPITSQTDGHLYCVVGNIYENKDLIND